MLLIFFLQLRYLSFVSWPLFLCSFVLSCILFRAIDLFSTVTILICFSALCFSIYLFFPVFFFVLLICFPQLRYLFVFQPFVSLFICSFLYSFSCYWSVFRVTTLICFSALYFSDSLVLYRIIFRAIDLFSIITMFILCFSGKTSVMGWYFSSRRGQSTCCGWHHPKRTSRVRSAWFLLQETEHSDLF